MTTVNYYARTNKSAKKWARKMGHVPTKVKLLKNTRKYHGCKLYKVTYHKKIRRQKK